MVDPLSRRAGLLLLLALDALALLQLAPLLAFLLGCGGWRRAGWRGRGRRGRRGRRGDPGQRDEQGLDGDVVADRDGCRLGPDARRGLGRERDVEGAGRK